MRKSASVLTVGTGQGAVVALDNHKSTVSYLTYQIVNAEERIVVRTKFNRGRFWPIPSLTPERGGIIRDSLRFPFSSPRSKLHTEQMPE